MTTENYTTKKTNGYVPLSEIQRLTKGHFFDASAKRFFNSRYPDYGYRLGDTIYFITSEKFTGLYEPDGQRLYTIRKLDMNTGNIDTVGEFNKLTKSEANTKFKHIINHN